MTLRRRQQAAAKATLSALEGEHVETVADGNAPEDVVVTPAPLETPPDDEPLTRACLTCGHLEEVEDLRAAFSCSECQAVNTSHLSIGELQAFEDGNREG